MWGLHPPLHRGGEPDESRRAPKIVFALKNLELTRREVIGGGARVPLDTKISESDERDQALIVFHWVATEAHILSPR